MYGGLVTFNGGKVTQNHAAEITNFTARLHAQSGQQNHRAAIFARPQPSTESWLPYITKICHCPLPHCGVCPLSPKYHRLLRFGIVPKENKSHALILTKWISLTTLKHLISKSLWQRSPLEHTARRNKPGVKNHGAVAVLTLCHHRPARFVPPGLSPCGLESPLIRDFRVKVFRGD